MVDFTLYKTMWVERFNELKAQIVQIPKDIREDNNEIHNRMYALLEVGFCEFVKFSDQKYLWYYRKLDQAETTSVLMKIRAYCGKKQGKLMIKFLRLNEKNELKLKV